MVWNPYDQYGLTGNPANATTPPRETIGNLRNQGVQASKATQAPPYTGERISQYYQDTKSAPTDNSSYQSQVPSQSGGNSNYSSPSYANSNSVYASGNPTSHQLNTAPPPTAAPVLTDAQTAAQAAAAAKAQFDATHETVSIPDPAADPTYKYQHAALEKALMNYQSGQTLGATQYNTNYNEGLNKLGWDGKGWSQDNQGAYAQARGDNTSDYASRGLGRSSAFADSLGMIDKTFNDQKSGLDRSKSDYSDTQRSALGAYTDQNSATDHGALLDAISRIATQKGVDLSQVTPGTVGSVTRLK